MTIVSSDTPITEFLEAVDTRRMLHRLIVNLSGFVYRRRADARWTMEFLSAKARDITGYDPHRYLGNQSLVFLDLIHPADRRRASDEINSALALRSRFTVSYRIMTAHRTTVAVEDRGIGVYDANGDVTAVEGVVDHARCALRAPRRAALHHG